MRSYLQYFSNSFDVGHQLKKLTLESHFEGDLINAFAKFCPDLKELIPTQLHVLEHLLPVLTHSNLQVLEVGLRTNETGLQTLSGRLTNLRTCRAREIVGYTTKDDSMRRELD